MDEVEEMMPLTAPGQRYEGQAELVAHVSITQVETRV